MTHHGKILVVDDDPAIRIAATVRLRTAGYDTMCACDGREAVALALESGPDAVVLDVRMPYVDGFAVLRQLRESNQTKHIPIVMLSASVQDQQAAIEAGARFFVRKPYQGKTLLAAVDSAISEAAQQARSDQQ